MHSRPYGASPVGALSQQVAQAEGAAAEAQRALHIANSSAAEAARYLLAIPPWLHYPLCVCQSMLRLLGGGGAGGYLGLH